MVLRVKREMGEATMSSFTWKERILAGGILTARKTLGEAQKLCDKIPDNKGYITEDNSDRNGAQNKIDTVLAKIGTRDSPASPWVFYNEATTKYDDAPLNSTLFLDLAAHLKSLPPSSDPEKVFFNIAWEAGRMARAQTAVFALVDQRILRK